MIEVILEALYWVFPAYVANAIPVLLGGGTPLDFGKKIRKHRVFGNSKTIRGTFLGVLFGSLVGLGMGRLELGILLSIGAVLGDLVGSFLKRRFDLKPSQPLLVLDQLDFVMGAVLLASLLEVPSLRLLIIIFIVTPVIHLITNYLAYKFGLKKVWW